MQKLENKHETLKHTRPIDGQNNVYQMSIFNVSRENHNLPIKIHLPLLLILLICEFEQIVKMIGR